MFMFVDFLMFWNCPDFIIGSNCHHTLHFVRSASDLPCCSILFGALCSGVGQNMFSKSMLKCDGGLKVKRSSIRLHIVAPEFRKVWE